MKHKHVVSQDDLAWNHWQVGEEFEGARKQLGAAAHGSQLGTSLIRLPPGKKAWPAHYHFANEEAIYILAGEGTMRLGRDFVAVAAGDYIAMPTDPELAHQLVNTGDQPLTYLCISTMKHPEVVGYPDSDKVGVLAGSAPGGSEDERQLTKFFPADSAVPYWQDEQ